MGRSIPKIPTIPVSRQRARVRTMSFDVAAVRARFPALAAGTAHFDNPGGSQTPDSVARAVHDTLVSPTANRGWVTAAERNAEDVADGAGQAVADLVGGDPRG